MKVQSLPDACRQRVREQIEKDKQDRAVKVRLTVT